MARKVALLLALLAAPAAAQHSLLTNLPACDALDGTEYLYLEQPIGVTGKKCDLLSIWNAGGVALDLGNDAVDDSIRILRINTTGDTNLIFTESPADELLIDASKDWPKADAADALAADPTDCAATNFATTIAANGDLTCAAITDADVPNNITVDLAAAATALAANGTNCSAGDAAAGVDASGNAEGCFTPGGGGGGDSIRVEDGDNAGTFTAMSDADFDDSGDINFTRTAGPPDVISATVRPNSVALGTDTTGGYAASVSEGGPATTATALAADPADCAANNYAKTIGANGDLGCAQPDHGSLGGLLDDDHTQYLLLAGRASSPVVTGSTLTSATFTIKAHSGTPPVPTLQIGGVSPSSYLHVSLSNNAAFYFTEQDATSDFGSGVVYQVNTDGTLGTLGRLMIGAVDTSAPGSARCISWDSFSSSLFYDTDCDGTADVGEDDLSTDDDVPDSGDFGALALTGDVASLGLATVIQANSVALTTDTTGNYVSSATASGGLTLTGTEGASLGLQDCAAKEVLRRNAGDTAWECGHGPLYTLGVTSLQYSPTDSETVYFGSVGRTPNATATISRVYVPVAGTISRADIGAHCATIGTSENWSLYIRKNNTTDTLVQTLGSASSFRVWSNSGLSISMSAGDYLEIKSVEPTWATNPVNCSFGGNVVVDIP